MRLKSMNHWIKYQKYAPSKTVPVTLPLSKSIAHRNLFLYALHGIPIPKETLSESRDTQLLFQCLSEHTETFDFQDAGTPARFALAYHAIKNIPRILTGNESLQKRSIKDLVDCLIFQGAQVEYLKNEGFFPVKIHQGIPKPYSTSWNITTQESSQMVSALLLGLTYLPLPITLKVTSLHHSWSYIRLTQKVLEHWGFEISYSTDAFSIGGSLKTPEPPMNEIDWGSATFLYLITLFTGISITLLGATEHSPQSDYACVNFFRTLGVETRFQSHSADLVKGETYELPDVFDGSDCPDLIPALVSACVFTNHPLIISGIEHLKTKESNRIESIRIHVNQLGWDFIRLQEDLYHLQRRSESFPRRLNIQTFSDHRIAMAFAPWAAVLEEVTLDDIECTQKSFPQFWEALKLCNFELHNTP